MNKLIALAAALALLSGPAAGIGQSAPAIADKSVRDDVFPPTAAPYPHGIVAMPHVEFANYVGYRPLQLDLYLHADRRAHAARPLVLWVHGGGWNRGDARGSGAFADWPAVLAALAARGYVVAAVDYRLSGEARFPAQVQDVKAAIRFLRDKAGAYGIDPKRVYLWGGSAGGDLVRRVRPRRAWQRARHRAGGEQHGRPARLPRRRARGSRARGQPDHLCEARHPTDAADPRHRRRGGGGRADPADGSATPGREGAGRGGLSRRRQSWLDGQDAGGHQALQPGGARSDAGVLRSVEGAIGGPSSQPLCRTRSGMHFSAHPMALALAGRWTPEQVRGDGRG